MIADFLGCLEFLFSLLVAMKLCSVQTQSNMASCTILLIQKIYICFVQQVPKCSFCPKQLAQRTGATKHAQRNGTEDRAESLAQNPVSKMVDLEPCFKN